MKTVHVPKVDITTWSRYYNILSQDRTSNRFLEHCKKLLLPKIRKRNQRRNHKHSLNNISIQFPNIENLQTVLRRFKCSAQVQGCPACGFFRLREQEVWVVSLSCYIWRNINFKINIFDISYDNLPSSTTTWHFIRMASMSCKKTKYLTNGCDNS